MPYTKEQQEEFQMQSMGCTTEQLVNVNGVSDPAMLAASILSDIQALLEMSNQNPADRQNLLERARQYANRAKCVLFEYKDYYIDQTGEHLPSMKSVYAKNQEK